MALYPRKKHSFSPTNSQLSGLVGFSLRQRGHRKSSTNVSCPGLVGIISRLAHLTNGQPSGLVRNSYSKRYACQPI